MKLSREAVLVSGLFLTCLLQIHCTLGRGLSTPEERARARNVARSLEQDPLSKDAPANSQWLLNWMIEVPDIRFKSCVDLLRPDVGQLFLQRASTVEHNLQNDVEFQQAGSSYR